jgi:hypothetical protein
MRAAKVIWSNNGWTFPQGNADYGVPVNGQNENYIYGLEEFLFNDQLIQRKLGYLDCYRAQNIDHVEDVLLFTLTPLARPRQIIVVGIMRGVQQLNDHEKIPVWNDFQQANYIQTVVNPAFQQIEELDNDDHAIGTDVFIENNYGVNADDLPLINGVAPQGLFLNLRYREIHFFAEDDDRRINLTAIDHGVNKAWGRLTILYHLENRPLIAAALGNVGLL